MIRHHQTGCVVCYNSSLSNCVRQILSIIHVPLSTGLFYIVLRDQLSSPPEDFWRNQCQSVMIIPFITPNYVFLMVQLMSIFPCIAIFMHINISISLFVYRQFVQLSPSGIFSLNDSGCKTSCVLLDTNQATDINRFFAFFKLVMKFCCPVEWPLNVVHCFYNFEVYHWIIGNYFERLRSFSE